MCSGQLQIPQNFFRLLAELHALVAAKNEQDQVVTVSLERGQTGRPRLILTKEYVSELFGMGYQ